MTVVELGRSLLKQRNGSHARMILIYFLSQRVCLFELHACVLKSSESRISSVDIPNILVLVVENW